MKKLELQLRSDLEHAKNDLGQVRQQIGELITREEQLEWQVRYIARLLAADSQSDGESLEITVQPSMTGPQVIEQILRESGKPLRILEIVDRALAKGFGGPNAEKRKVFANFSSILSRGSRRKDSIFKKVDRGVFGLNLPSVAPG